MLRPLHQRAQFTQSQLSICLRVQVPEAVLGCGPFVCCMCRPVCVLTASLFSPPFFVHYSSYSRGNRPKAKLNASLDKSLLRPPLDGPRQVPSLSSFVLFRSATHDCSALLPSVPAPAPCPLSTWVPLSLFLVILGKCLLHPLDTAARKLSSSSV